MGLFSFTQEIAVDLGTANTIISTEGKIVVDEPSVVALDGSSGKMIAVGEQAKLWYEKSDSSIKVIRPLKDGQWTKITVVGQSAEGETDGYLRIENSRSATIYISKVKVGYYPEH